LTQLRQDPQRPRRPRLVLRRVEPPAGAEGIGQRHNDAAVALEAAADQIGHGRAVAQEPVDR